MSNESEAKANASLAALKTAVTNICAGYKKLLDEANNTAGDGLTGEQTEVLIDGVDALTNTLQTAFAGGTVPPGPIVVPDLPTMPGPFRDGSSEPASRSGYANPAPARGNQPNQRTGERGGDQSIDPKSGMKR